MTIKKIHVLSFAQAVGAVFAVPGLLISFLILLFMAMPYPNTKLEALLIIVVYQAMLFVISFTDSALFRTLLPRMWEE